MFHVTKTLKAQIITSCRSDAESPASLYFWGWGWEARSQEAVLPKELHSRGLGGFR